MIDSFKHFLSHWTRCAFIIPLTLTSLTLITTERQTYANNAFAEHLTYNVQADNRQIKQDIKKSKKLLKALKLKRNRARTFAGLAESSLNEEESWLKERRQLLLPVSEQLLQAQTEFNKAQATLHLYKEKSASLSKTNEQLWNELGNSNRYAAISIATGLTSVAFASFAPHPSRSLSANIAWITSWTLSSIAITSSLIFLGKSCNKLSSIGSTEQLLMNAWDDELTQQDYVNLEELRVHTTNQQVQTHKEIISTLQDLVERQKKRFMTAQEHVSTIEANINRERASLAQNRITLQRNHEGA